MAYFVFHGRESISMVFQSCANAMLCSNETYPERVHKEKKCTPQNQVLCSYFMKTSLFWTFETTDTKFWLEENLRDCIRYSITEFTRCLHDSVLRHYFIPGFNLFSVKLTREAQRELLQLYDIVIQCDISILKECKTLRPVWSKFLSADNNQISIRCNTLKRTFTRNDELMAVICNRFHLIVTLELSSKSLISKSVLGEEFCKFGFISQIFESIHE